MIRIRILEILPALFGREYFLYQHRLFMRSRMVSCLMQGGVQALLSLQRAFDHPLVVVNGQDAKDRVEHGVQNHHDQHRRHELGTEEEPA